MDKDGKASGKYELREHYYGRNGNEDFPYRRHWSVDEKTGKKLGMKLMDDSLFELCAEGIISKEEAMARSEIKATMRQNLATLA